MFQRFSSTLAALLVMAVLAAAPDTAWSQAVTAPNLAGQQRTYQIEIQTHIRAFADQVEKEIRAGDCEYVASTLRRLSFYLEEGFVPHYEWETGRRWTSARGPDLTEFQQGEIVKYARYRYERLIRIAKVDCPQTIAAIVSGDPCLTDGPAPTTSSGSSTAVGRYASDDEREHEAWARRLGRDLRAREAYAQDRRQVLIEARFVECARRSAPRKVKSFGGEFGFGNFNAQPTDFFIFRNPFTGEERRGIFRPDADTRIMTGGAGFSLDIPKYSTKINLFAGIGSGSTSASVGTIDPLGNFLGIAGTGDPTAPFPEGVLLGSGVPLGTSNGFNVLRDVFYRRDLDFTTFGGEAAFGLWRYRAFAPDRLGGMSVTPHVGVAYTHWEVDEVTSFRIPGFLTEGAYRSSYVNDAFTAYAGARVDLPFRINPNVFVIPYVKGSAGATFNRLEGDDWLNLSGFINTQQWVGVSADHTGLFLQLQGGVNVAVGNVCLGGSVTYTRDENYASFVRTGLTGQTTQAQFNESEAIVGRISARYAFGVPQGSIVDTAAFATCP
jgi:hypothetical protein